MKVIVQDNYWDDQQGEQMDAIRQWLENAGVYINAVYKSRYEEFPTDKDLEMCDLYVLSGGVNPDLTHRFPWLAKVQAFVKKCIDKEVPLLGLCFAHQLVGKIIGGTIEKSPGGKMEGIQRIQTTAAFQDMFGKEKMEFDVPKQHRNIVTNIPDSALVLARSDQIGIEMFSVGYHVLCILGHPERNPDDKVLQEVVLPFFRPHAAPILCC